LRSWGLRSREKKGGRGDIHSKPQGKTGGRKKVVTLEKSEPEGKGEINRKEKMGHVNWERPPRA